MYSTDIHGNLNKSNDEHRKRCAKRIFIGPWDIHTSQPTADNYSNSDNDTWSENHNLLNQRQHFDNNNNNFDYNDEFFNDGDDLVKTDDASIRLLSSQESVRSLHDEAEEEQRQSQRPSLNNRSRPVSSTTIASSSVATTNDSIHNSSPFMTPSSDGTSFLTARTHSTFSTIYHSVNSSLSTTPKNIFAEGSIRASRISEENEDEDEPIDYQFLQSTDILNSSPPELPRDKLPDDSESVLTIRPSKSLEKKPLNAMSGAKSIQYSLSEQQQQQQDNVGSDHYPDRKNTTARLYPKRKRKPLIWKKKSTSTSTLSLPSTTGTISTPFSSPQLASTDHLPPTIIIAPEPNDPLLKFKPIKKDPMLCKRTVNGSDGSEPSQYKASREARYNLLTEEWKQIELVLTPTYITTYSFSTYFWPKRRVEHRIYLEGSKKPKKLELRLLSPLDYTFSLRYQHQATISKSSLKKSSSSRRIITMIFKAKSFLKCQEWYMKLYDMLPAENKRPIPKYCEVYLPTLDLTVHLPLTDDNRKHMTMEDVKHAVLDILEQEKAEAQEAKAAAAEINNDDDLKGAINMNAVDMHPKNLLHHFVPHDHPFNDTMNEDDYGLCWTLGDRIEWIHWTHTPAPVQPLATNNIIKEQRRMDWAVSPQIIEQTHRLELRRIEHTPNDIILSREKNFILKEPPPIEGFLTRISDFSGSIAGPFRQSRKTNYVATFDQFLFYVPETKVEPPPPSCLVISDEEEEQNRDDHGNLTALISPTRSTATRKRANRSINQNTATAPAASTAERYDRSYLFSITPYQRDVTSEAQTKEMTRRMKLITDAKGIIDLTEVSYVRRNFSHEIYDNDGKLASTKRSSRASIIPCLTRRSSATERGPIRLENDEMRASRNNLFFKKPNRKKPCLELVMENGIQIKFEVHSSDTCDLWVNYLAQLVVYWKARKEAEKEARSQDNNNANGNFYSDLDHQYDKNNGQFKGKNITLRDKDSKNTEKGCIHRQKEVMADTRIWSYCLYDQCRDIVKSGVLYYKPYRRGTYSQKICILTVNGWLLFYDVFHRASSKPRCNHEKKGAIDISGCYFYSGLDCSKRKKGSNHYTQERDFLLQRTARIYSNGLSVEDDTLSRIFSIWKPKIRRYFSTKRKRLTAYHHTKDQQWLNPQGQTWTFLAQSRREKEEWVCALNVVAEHMLRSESRY